MGSRGLAFATTFESPGSTPSINDSPVAALLTDSVALTAGDLPVGLKKSQNLFFRTSLDPDDVTSHTASQHERVMGY